MKRIVAPCNGTQFVGENVYLFTVLVPYRKSQSICNNNNNNSSSR